MKKEMSSTYYQNIENFLKNGEVTNASAALHQFDKNHNISFEPLFDTMTWAKSTQTSQREIYERRKNILLSAIEKQYRIK
jgi:hypothetical protein